MRQQLALYPAAHKRTKRRGGEGKNFDAGKLSDSQAHTKMPRTIEAARTQHITSGAQAISRHARLLK